MFSGGARGQHRHNCRPRKEKAPRNNRPAWRFAVPVARELFMGLAPARRAGGPHVRSRRARVRQESPAARTRPMPVDGPPERLAAPGQTGRNDAAGGKAPPGRCLQAQARLGRAGPGSPDNRWFVSCGRLGVPPALLAPVCVAPTGTCRLKFCSADRHSCERAPPGMAGEPARTALLAGPTARLTLKSWADEAERGSGIQD